MSERTWEDIGNEIRDDYLRDGGPENVRFREVQWEVWIAEVEWAAAEKALTDAAEATLREAPGEPHAGATFESHAVWLRARAAEIRKRK